MNDRRGEDSEGDSEDNCARSGSWRKSSFSMSAGDCIEVAVLSDAYVGVRDSKVTAGPHLRFSLDSWATFLAEVRITSKGDGPIR